MLKALCICSIVLVSGCECALDNLGMADEIPGEYKWVYSANPGEDIQQAIDNRDYRFMGVYGYTLVTPGVSRSCLSSINDINPIEGTSDFMHGYEQIKFNALAYVYAEHYNFLMKVYLEENREFSCGKQQSEQS